MLAVFSDRRADFFRTQCLYAVGDCSNGAGSAWLQLSLEYRGAVGAEEACRKGLVSRKSSSEKEIEIKPGKKQRKSRFLFDMEVVLLYNLYW